jgi:hypothetical protein
LAGAKEILHTGANCILSTGQFDHETAEYLTRRGVMGVSRVPDHDLADISKAAGGKHVLFR